MHIIFLCPYENPMSITCSTLYDIYPFVDQENEAQRCCDFPKVIQLVNGGVKAQIFIISFLSTTDQPAIFTGLWFSDKWSPFLQNTRFQLWSLKSVNGIYIDFYYSFNLYYGIQPKLQETKISTRRINLISNLPIYLNIRCVLLNLLFNFYKPY